MYSQLLSTTVPASGDIEPLAKHLAERHCKKLGMPVPNVSATALQKLVSYPWRGNVRELDNVIQRALILSEQGDIGSDHILLEGVDWEDANSLQAVVESGDVVYLPLNLLLNPIMRSQKPWELLLMV